MQCKCSQFYLRRLAPLRCARPPPLDARRIYACIALPSKITGDTKNQVSVQATAAGDVSDYDATKKAALECAMATVAGVECNAVTVTVTTGSVVLDFVIITANPATAAAVKATVATALATTAGASTALGVTVEAVPTVAVSTTPTTTSSDEGLSVGGMVGIAVGGMVVGGIGVGICVFGYMQSKTKYWQNVASPAGTSVKIESV